MYRLDRRPGWNKGGLTGATPAERIEIEVRTQQLLRQKLASGTPCRNDDRPGPRTGRVFHHPNLAREA